MGALASYRLRLERKRLNIRAIRKRRELKVICDRTDTINPSDVLSFSTIRNERVRLPYFLEYYRDLGVGHFFFVDNGSTDDTEDYLRAQPDVTLFHTAHSYKRSKFGVDWLNWLMSKYAIGHWILSVDVDEFFVYPFCDTRPLQALTDWLDASQLRSFGTLLLDLYPKEHFGKKSYVEGECPIAHGPYFDHGNYFIEKNHKYGNLWIQGGVRQRVLFRDRPEHGPALNKIPLVKWQRGNAFVSSTHSLLPRGLNLVYDEWGGEKASGCLLHTKFLNTLGDKAVEELDRKQHYAAGREYNAYASKLSDETVLWSKHSAKYKDWRQLERLGLISNGNWA